MFTFKQFLLNEDLAQEVAQLRSQLSLLTAKKSQQDSPVDRQIMALTTQLANKEKQLAAQEKAAPPKAPAPPEKPSAPGATAPVDRTAPSAADLANTY